MCKENGYYVEVRPEGFYIRSDESLNDGLSFEEAREKIVEEINVLIPLSDYVGRGNADIRRLYELKGYWENISEEDYPFE